MNCHRMYESLQESVITEKSATLDEGGKGMYDDYDLEDYWHEPDDPASFYDEEERRQYIIETGDPYDEENDLGPSGEWPWQYDWDW